MCCFHNTVNIIKSSNQYWVITVKYILAVIMCLVGQSCPTLCQPWTVACQVPLSMRTLQARILKWVAMFSSRGSSQPRDRTHVSLQVDSLYLQATREVLH